MGSPIFVFREVDRDRFEEVRNGAKVIETRAGTEKYRSIKIGDEVTFTCGNDSFSKKVTKEYHWSTIEVMLIEVPLKKVMLDLETVDQVRERYASYPNYKEKIAKFGIVGFELLQV